MGRDTNGKWKPSDALVNSLKANAALHLFWVAQHDAWTYTIHSCRFYHVYPFLNFNSSFLLSQCPIVWKVDSSITCSAKHCGRFEGQGFTEKEKESQPQVLSYKMALLDVRFTLFNS